MRELEHHRPGKGTPPSSKAANRFTQNTDSQKQKVNHVPEDPRAFFPSLPRFGMNIVSPESSRFLDLLEGGITRRPDSLASWVGKGGGACLSEDSVGAVAMGLGPFVKIVARQRETGVEERGQEEGQQKKSVFI